MDTATSRTWLVDNEGASGGKLVIHGWDFGGTGDLALLQHANGMCAALWLPVARRLRTRYHVIALDARGHGDSEHLEVPGDYAWTTLVGDLARVIEQILAEEGAREIALGLGSSFGGILIAATEARVPGTFRRIVMLDPPIHPTAELIAAMRIDFPADGSPRGGIVEQTLKRRAVWPSRDAAREAWQNKPLFSAWVPEAFSLYLEEGMRDLDDGHVELKCRTAVEAHIFETTGSLGLMDYAPHVRAPVELVHAARGFSQRPFYERIATTFPNCRLRSIDAGHMLPLEAPDAVCDLVESL